MRRNDCDVCGENLGEPKCVDCQTKSIINTMEDRLHFGVAAIVFSLGRTIQKEIIESEDNRLWVKHRNATVYDRYGIYLPELQYQIYIYTAGAGCVGLTLYYEPYKTWRQFNIRGSVSGKLGKEYKTDAVLKAIKWLEKELELTYGAKPHALFGGRLNKCSCNSRSWWNNFCREDNYCPSCNREELAKEVAEVLRIGEE